jgi:hypothetical protein
MKCIKVAGLIVLAIALGNGTEVHAQIGDPTQDGGSAPDMAMGSGRMVRGTVSAVTPGKITVKTEAGDIFQIAISPNTRLMKDRQPVKATEVKVGDVLGAGGEMDQSTKTLHALFVSVVDAEQVKKLRDSLGKTWIQGKITAMDELKLTVLRGDKVIQVIAVDEDTSFKRGGRQLAMAMQGDGSAPARTERSGERSAGGTNPNGGGESITLAEVKVGDMIAGQGSLKNGVFVPTMLAVMDPSQRRRRQGDPAPAPGTATEPK